MIKCIIWDLDNTVWKGIFSEEKVEIREDILDLIRKANNSGILQSICSKNDVNIITPFLEKIGITDLFIYPQINYEDKYININRFSKLFNVKNSDILFVDDDPFERKMVENTIQEIHISDGKDSEILRKQIFESQDIQLTTEAKNRNKFYKNEEERILFQKSKNMTKLQFLEYTHIKAEIREAKNGDLNRIKELFERTNQMNTTGHIFSESDIYKIINNNENKIIYVCEVQDRFGSYGIGAVINMEITQTKILVHNLIVSCRLLGKGISQSLLYFIEQKAKKERKRLLIVFKRNKYNRHMYIFIMKSGFRKIENSNFYELNDINMKNKAPWVELKF